MAAKKRILVVDDEPGIGVVLRVEFGLSGYDVTTTTSGAAAIELIRTQEPDVVLLDALMPDVSGTDVLRTVRDFSQVPIILLTGQAEIGRSALELGANDYITKPFNHELLMDRVRSVLGAGKRQKTRSTGKKRIRPIVDEESS
jgi:DNA-binding response OmpR family regulator